MTMVIEPGKMAVKKEHTEGTEELKVQENFSIELDEAAKLIDSAEEEHEDLEDYTALTKEEIIARAGSLLHTANVRKAQVTLNNLRDALEAIEKAERPAMIKAWADAGHDPRDFKPVQDEFHQQFNKISHQFREKREEERRRAEQEKLSNLKLREAVLDRMKDLVTGEENEHSLKLMRELMREWREIRHVPKEFQEELYKRYRFYVEKFYDNLSIFNELKDLDREKNLEVKIELIKKVQNLKDEKNLRKALVTLNKYHEDWHNAGPVRREISDEIWSRFKAASDAVLADKKALQEELDKVKQQNLELKKLLVEKAEAAIAVLPEKVKDWGNLSKELDALMAEWKKIGPVPREVNQEIWNKFRGVRNAFYEGRREFFKGLNSSREENLNAKIALCVQAEKLMDNEEFAGTTEKLNQLQEQWKKIGPVPDNKNDDVWKRFRAAFDHFYNRKNAFYESRRSQEKDAVKEKESIIEELKSLQDLEDGQLVFQKLKDAQMRWAKSGFVSGKTFHNLQKKYQDYSEALFTKFKRSSDEMKESVMKDHYETLAGSPDGKLKLQGEERRLRDRLQKLRDEVSTIENNKSFFTHSKNATDILKQFDSNIQKANAQIEKLEKELKVIRAFKNK